ncbi:hypothetical protein Taro_013986 [Colocasia esculenta]|uniref:Uncharacterized protein n=1 Tax=Colocasia esculenta TaxID=4460 RepID=A0A843UKI0_COLES|nr:hypothetical protein [Colocasia esculenta]
MGKKLGGEYYEVSILIAHDPTASLFIKDADRKNMNDAVGSHIIWFREYVEFLFSECIMCSCFFKVFYKLTGVTKVVRLCGSAGWAQSAHKFFVYERDRAWRRVLNVMALVVTFWLPPRCSLHLHARSVSCTRRHADVGLEKATP